LQDFWNNNHHAFIFDIQEKTESYQKRELFSNYVSDACNSFNSLISTIGIACLTFRLDYCGLFPELYFLAFTYDIGSTSVILYSKSEKVEKNTKTIAWTDSFDKFQE